MLNYLRIIIQRLLTRHLLLPHLLPLPHQLQRS